MLDENSKIESNVLATLERLGFPMHEEGTLFYKDIIADASRSVMNIFSGESEESIISLFKRLEETNSSFYEKVADKKKIDSSELQSKINKALSGIDREKTDMQLYKEIFCTRPNTFGDQIIYLSLYHIGFSFGKDNDTILKLENVNN